MWTFSETLRLAFHDLDPAGIFIQVECYNSTLLKKIFGDIGFKARVENNRG
jgi:hypothetical protein